MTHNEEQDRRLMKALGIRPEPLPSPQPQMETEFVTVPKRAWDEALAAYFGGDDYEGDLIEAMAEVSARKDSQVKALWRVLWWAAVYCGLMTVAFGVALWRLRR